MLPKTYPSYDDANSNRQNLCVTTLVRTIGKRIGSAIRYLRNRGLVKSEKEPGQCLVWEIDRS